MFLGGVGRECACVAFGRICVLPGGTLSSVGSIKALVIALELLRVRPESREFLRSARKFVRPALPAWVVCIRLLWSIARGPFVTLKTARSTSLTIEFTRLPVIAGWTPWRSFLALKIQ